MKGQVEGREGVCQVGACKGSRRLFEGMYCRKQ